MIIKNKIKLLHILLALLAIAIVLFINRTKVKIFFGKNFPWVVNIMRREGTVGGVIAKYGEPAKKRILPYFQKASVNYPPDSLILLVIKKDRELQVYAANKDKTPVFIRSYPLRAKSGKLGPKLREGDFQIPEGIYKITSLNPNSRYHLSMRINYPNNFDLEKAKADGRDNPGRDIFIHGKAASIGCVSIGDEPIEELFVLSENTGLDKIKVVICPVDFRKEQIPEEIKAQLPNWIDQLYGKLRSEIGTFPLNK